LGIELLEKRWLLANVFWDVDSDGSWNVATNWRDESGTQRIPAAGDDVFLDRPGGPFTITHDAGNHTIRSLHAGDENFAITGGSLAISSASEVRGNFTLGGGELIAAPDVFLTASGASVWSGGRIHGGYVEGEPGTGGLRNEGLLKLEGATDKVLGATLANAGVIEHSGSGNLHFAVSLGSFFFRHGILRNLAGGMYDLQSSAIFTGNDSPSAILNDGVFRKSGSGNLTLRQVQPGAAGGLGTFEIQAGELTLPLVGGVKYRGGRFDVNEASAVNLIGGGGLVPVQFAENFVGRGVGPVRLASGVIQAVDQGLTLDFNPGRFEWLDGSFRPSEASPMSNLGKLGLLGSAHKTLQSHVGGNAVLHNLGVIEHVGPGGFGGAAVLNNRPGGTYDFQADVGNSFDRFFNEGTVRKSSGAGVAGLPHGRFANLSGTIEVLSGALHLGGGTTTPTVTSTGGLLHVHAGAVLDLTGGGEMRYAGIYNGLGAGKVRLSGGTLFVVAAGTTFDFPAGLFEWTGGMLHGGTSGLNNTGDMLLAGSSTKTLQGTLHNTGTITHTDTGSLETFRAVLNNLSGGLYELRGDQDFTQNSSDLSQFNNYGTLRKSGGSDVSTVLGTQFNNRGGIIDVDSGTFVLKAGGNPRPSHHGGRFLVAANAAIELVGGDFATFTGVFTGEGGGSVRFASGTLVIGAGGATFDFEPQLFEWHNGAIEATLGPLTNRGEISLPIAGFPTLRGVLNNEGVVALGRDAGLLLDGVSGVFNNQPMGVLDIRGDNGGVFRAPFTGNGGAFHNSGTIRKSSGAATTSFTTGLFSNAGVLEAASGTVRIESSVAQSSGATLTGGTWIARADSAIELTNVPDFTRSQATIVLDGPNSNLARANTLEENLGSFSLLGGRDFATVSGLTNGGTLMLGPGSVLTVNGPFTQSASGALNTQIGGAPDSGQFGQLMSTGTSTLAGSLGISLANGFGPTTGQSFEVLTYLNHSESFSSYSGLRQGRFQLFDARVEAARAIVTAQSSAPDLKFESFDAATFPAIATLGQNVTLKYMVRNLSETPAEGVWFDSVYLSRDGVLDPSDVLLTRVERTGGLLGMASYEQTVTATLPPVRDGAYRVIVLADSRGLTPDSQRSNNRGVSQATISVTVPVLSLGLPVMGTLAPGQNLYYRLFAPPGDDLRISGDFDAAPGGEVYLRYGELPDPGNFDQRSAPGLLNPSLLLINPRGGWHYVLVRGREDASGPTPFHLQAVVAGFEVLSVTPARGSLQAGSVTLTLVGAHFTPQATVKLRGPGEERLSQPVQFVHANQLRATFQLAGLPPANYQVVVEQAGETAAASEPFEVDDAEPGELTIELTAPRYIRVVPQRAIFEFYAHLRAYNESETLRRTLIRIQATNVGGGDVESRFLFTLTPGYADARHLKYNPNPRGPHIVSELSLTAQELPTEVDVPIEWEPLKGELQPSTIPDDAWDAIWQNLKAEMGQTASDYSELLTRVGAALSDNGAVITDTARLFDFVRQQANGRPAIPVPASAIDAAFPAPGVPLLFGRDFGDTIAARYRLGRLGRGWIDNFDIRIDEDDEGRVTMRLGDNLRYFYRDPNTALYLGFPGDFASLTKENNAFELRELGGGVTRFRADGSLDFIQDANGNRLSAGYTGDQLTSITHTNGSTLTFAYNAQGRIRQVIDPNGDVATYEYDPSGEHLVRVTTTAGSTEYTYTPAANGPVAHALAAITHAAGTHLFFQYDGQGRLVRQEADGGALAVRYAYDTASVSVRDAQDRTTTIFYDDQFQTRKIRDPLGRVTEVSYDADGNPITFAVAGGGAAQLGYDALGNVISGVNAIGETEALAYQASHNRLARFEDALGQAISFSYDANGNSRATTFADGSTEQYSYDSQGNVTRTVNRLGQTINYFYNNRGQLTRKDLPGNTRVEYTYNVRGNLETVIDASGTIRLDYLDPQHPDLVTRFTYPSGRFLEYEYEDFRRTRMVDQSGFEVHYRYDPLGRLEFLRDGSDNLITQYAYDAVGRLVRETRGNGTTTNYVYDDAGQALEIAHRAPDAMLLSLFRYDYDALGRRTSLTTLDGTTAYGYDGAGRLTSVTLPGGEAIAYAYDAAGNRTVVSANDVDTYYTTNNLNQYTSIGGRNQSFDLAGDLVSADSDGLGRASFQYDAEGRLVSQITRQGTWTHEYDAFGNRQASTLNGVRTQYLVDPFGLQDVVAEYDAGGNLQARYVHGFGLTSRFDSSGSSAYYQFDALGNTALLTGVGGDVLNSYSYLPFGEALTVSETVANPFEFVGEYGVMREGSGLDYMRNRWYDPHQGRFTQPDPLGLAGGTNLYAYVGNNPMTWTDPTGLIKVNPFEDRIVTRALEAEANVVSSQLQRANSAYISSAEKLAAEFGEATVVNNGGGTAGLGSTLETQPEIPVTATDIPPGGTARGAASLEFLGVQFELLKGLYAIFAGSNAIAQGYEVYKTGEVPPCTPGIPASLQACEDTGRDIALDLALDLAYPAGPLGSLIKSITRLVEQITSDDPNDIVGPSGFGSQQYVTPGGKLPYTINFQNKPEASAPAAEVVVTHTLNADVDMETFELGDFGFGDVIVEVPIGRQFHRTRLDLRASRGLFLDVTAELNRATRAVTWTFSSLDPTTLDLPADPFQGFLPPDQNVPEGQGFVTFFVEPKVGLPNGTPLDAQATIVFDANPPLDTNTWVNTIDASLPSSAVTQPVAFADAGEFTVSWEGNDEGDDSAGSGIATYDVFVSDNGGPYVLWQDNTLNTSAVFNGALRHTYSFYAVATDNVGHIEPAPATADVSVTVLAALSVEAGADRLAVEGEAISLTEARFVLNDDPSTWSGAVDWGDGEIEALVLVPEAGGGKFSNTHRYADDGAYLVKLVLQDTFGRVREDALQVQVANASPTVTLVGSPSVDEGALYTLTIGAVTDAGTDDVEGYVVRWGDGSQTVLTAAAVAEAGGKVTHVYPKGVGEQTLVVDVVDEDGAHLRAGAQTVLIHNVAPTLADRTLIIAENQPVGVEVGTLVASDASASPVFTYSIDSGNISGVFEIDNAGKIRVANAAALNHEQLAQVSLRVTATDDGLPAQSASAMITIDVSNVNEAPTAISLTPSTAEENLSGLTIGSLAAADEDAGDAHVFFTNDARFEIVGGQLKLRDGVSLSLDDGGTVEVQVTARDGGAPALEATRDLLITIAPNPFPWQNRRVPLDTTADTFISPLDALVVINLLILPSTPLLTTATNQLPRSRPVLTDLAYFDVNGDGFATAVDVLNVVNSLIDPFDGEGYSLPEGEGDQRVAWPLAQVPGGNANRSPMRRAGLRCDTLSPSLPSVSVSVALPSAEASDAFFQRLAPSNWPARADALEEDSDISAAFLDELDLATCLHDVVHDVARTLRRAV